MQDNPLAATNQKKAFTPNKGHQIWLGDTYVGYIVIGEKNTPKETVADLQEPDGMAAILSMAELRPFKAAEDRDMSSVQEIIEKAKLDKAVAAELAKEED